MVPKAHGQTSGSDWIIFSELSPTPRSGNNRILKNTNDNFHLEWRNRIGKMINNNTVIGLMGNYRQYSYTEAVTYSLEFGSATYSYDYTSKNTLWGTGPFVTRFFQLSSRLQLQATLFGLYEAGKGSYNMTLTGFDCPSCSTPGFSFAGKTGNIENQGYREKNFYGGLDLGISYALTPRLSLLSGINLVQYENYSITDGNRISPTLYSSALYRQLQVKGNEATVVFNRPIIHFGIMLVLGKQASQGI